MSAAHLGQIEVPVKGIDCPSCAGHIEETIQKLPGIAEVRVLVSASRVDVRFDPERTCTELIHQSLERAGYPVLSRGDRGAHERGAAAGPGSGPFAKLMSGWGAFAVVVLVVAAVVAGEQTGFFDNTLERLPWWVLAPAIVAGGWRVFRPVFLGLRRGQISSHTLMTAGVIASASIGQWATAALIVFFMRFADAIEGMTTSRSREALRGLVSIRPASARVLRGDVEAEVPISEVTAGELILVRSGERIPVDGEVVEGYASVDEAAITGESVPADKQVGQSVFAATVAQGGFLKLRATRVGGDTTFARIIRLVEESEAQRAPVQRFANKFCAYYLPAVLLMAGATYLVTQQVVNAVAVLVVACGCAIALATPVVVLASVGYGARKGLLVKGGIALEQLARVDTVVIDKTGTLTRGESRLTDLLSLPCGCDEDAGDEPGLLQAVASLEARSEHPLARAIVDAAREQGMVLTQPDEFVSLPGRGITGRLGDDHWTVGNRRLLAENSIPISSHAEECAQAMESAGQTAFFASRNGHVVALLAVADVPRSEARAALAELRRMGMKKMLLLTGDNERVAAATAAAFDLEFRANLLPEDKIAAVRELQAAGHVVLMVGDGVNDAPALAQADVGVAMGAAGTDVAIEAADVALMRDDWNMVPEAIYAGRRAARTIRQNLGFTAISNVVGISLAAAGLLPPIWAAAAHSLPDVVILANSGKLMREPRKRRNAKAGESPGSHPHGRDHHHHHEHHPHHEHHEQHEHAEPHEHQHGHVQGHSHHQHHPAGGCTH
jgi:P-type Cu+ transporter